MRNQVVSVGLFWILFSIFGCSVELPSEFNTPAGAAGEEAGGSESSGEETPSPGESGDESPGEESSGEGGDAPEVSCETIADCTGSLENPCVQPNCTAGICGEQPLEPGTDCLAEEFDTECAVATCSLEGECEFQVVAAGTGCTPDAGGDPSTCNVFACDGEGACVETPVEDGTACSGEGSPCEIRRCLSGSCELDPGICADGYTCTEDHCIASLSQCTFPAEDAPAVAVTACQFTMTVGQWEGEKQTYLGTPLGQDGNLDFTWCNAEFSGEPGHDSAGCLPAKSWQQFRSEMAQAGAAQATDFTLCISYADTLQGETICGASGNPCSLAACLPTNGEADSLTGCVQTSLTEGSACSAVGSCYPDGTETTCQPDPDTPGELACLDSSGTPACQSASVNPCVVSTCNVQTGQCELAPSWESDDSPPSCSVASALVGKVGPGNEEPCGAGVCALCEASDGTGCEGAKCVPFSPSGFQCDSAKLPGLCAQLTGFKSLPTACGGPAPNLDGGDGTGITPEFKTCEVPCWVYSAECLECLLVPETGCEIAFQELHSDLVASENADFPKDEYPNLYQSQEWKDAIYACIPEVFPAVVTPEVGEAVDFKYVGNEFMKPCIEPYLMPWFEAFTVPADQKEKFFTGTGNALAFLFLKTPPEMCLEKPDDEENACAVLSDLTPGTKYSCSDTRLGYSGFQVRVGDLDFEVPICTPICDAPNSEANDPDESAIDGTCIETPNDGMSCQTLQFE